MVVRLLLHPLLTITILTLYPSLRKIKELWALHLHSQEEWALVYGLHQEGRRRLHECRVRLLRPHYLDHIIQIKQDTDRITSDVSIWTEDVTRKKDEIINLLVKLWLGKEEYLFWGGYKTQSLVT